LCLFSRNGFSFQSPPVVARSAAVAPDRSLREKSSRRFLVRGDVLVLSYRPLAVAHLPTPRHRYRRWFCPGRILLLPLSRAFARVASRGEPSHRFLLYSRSGGRFTHGRDVLAMGSPASLANDRARHGGDWILRSRSGHFSQDERQVAVEHAVCAGALFARSIFLSAVLPQPMSIL